MKEALSEEEKLPDVCVWGEDSNGNWWTDCDECFVFSDGGPANNGMKFCCYCGAELQEKIYEETDDGDE